MKRMLIQFAEFIIAEVKARKATGALKSSAIPFLHEKLISFEYVAGSIMSASWDDHYVVGRLIWDRDDQLEFVDEIICKSRQFQECLDAIAKNSNDSQRSISFALREFCIKIAASAFENDITDSFLSRQVGILIDDLTDKPIEWTVVVQLQGVWPSKKRLKLSDAVILRQPRSSDLEAEASVGTGFSEGLLLGRTKISSILEIAVADDKHGNKAQNEMFLMIELLCLFRLGSVGYRQYSLSPDSFSGLGYQTLWRELPNQYRYEFRTEDIQRWASFVGRMRAYLGKSSKPPEYVKIAFQRYKDALFETNVDARIALAISCIEALFLTETVELKFRLRIRVATLLRMVGFDGSDVYANVGLAYDVRSSYSHGSLHRAKNADKLKLSEIVLDYARVGLLIFFQLPEKKSDFLPKLDKSLFEENTIVQISENIKDLIIV